MVIRDGIILYAQPGALPQALEQLIAKARELDMDEVPAERRGTRQPRPVPGVLEPSGFTGWQSARLQLRCGPPRIRT